MDSRRLSAEIAVIEFEPDGTIRTANEVFEAAMGYRLSEIAGKHHRMFVDPVEAATPGYAQFWRDLAEGKLKQDEVRRFAKGGREIWLQATYTPILDGTGRVFKVVKFASDVTNRHNLLAKTAGTCQMMAGDSRALRDLAERLSQNAQDTAREAEEAARAGEDVLRRVESAATHSGEMLNAIQEISRSASQAALVVREAVAAAEASNQRIARLGESSRAIGSVVELIQAIAQQTNLLALNATIEASRAGDAGRGFAVVADEVKQLAHRTQQATQEIGSRIQSIQEDSVGAVQAIGNISRVVAQIDAITGTIAAAVEEQTVTTNEIAQNAQQAAVSTAGISRSIAVVAKAAKETVEGAQQTRQTAASVTTAVEHLEALSTS